MVSSDTLLLCIDRTPHSLPQSAQQCTGRGRLWSLLGMVQNGLYCHVFSGVASDISVWTTSMLYTSEVSWTESRPPVMATRGKRMQFSLNAVKDKNAAFACLALQIDPLKSVPLKQNNSDMSCLISSCFLPLKSKVEITSD